jgi:hypothetical protein
MLRKGHHVILGETQDVCQAPGVGLFSEAMIAKAVRRK